MELESKIEDSTRKVSGFGGEFLTAFALKDNSDGASIEVMGCAELMMVPESVGGVRGVIYLDGEVIPVVDILMKQGNGLTKIGGSACILLIEHKWQNKQCKVGLIAGDISDVLEIVGVKINTPGDNLGLGKPDTDPGSDNHCDLVEALRDLDKIMYNIDFESFN